MTDFTSCRFGAEHDRVQPPGEHESHNDSVYFNFAGSPARDEATGAEEGVGGATSAAGASGLAGGVLRIGLRPNEGYSEASLVLPLRGGGTVFHYLRSPLDRDAIEVGAPTWRSGPLSLGAVEPTRRWRLRYAGDEPRLIADAAAFASAPGETWRASERVALELELDWIADFPVHTLSEGGALMPGGDEERVDYGRSHLEQFGRVHGAIAIGGEEWRLDDAPAFRDHSWGPRVWESAPDQDFVTAYLDDGTRVVAVANRLDGRETFHGVRWRPGDAEPTRLDRYAIRTGYAGGPVPQSPIGFEFGAGDETIEIEGEVTGHLPLRVGRRPVRIAQTLLRLGGEHPGHAKTDLTRPMSDT